MSLTRISNLIINHKATAQGGPGNRNPTTVKRVPHSLGAEVDALIEDWENRCDSSTSPRYHFLRHFLFELSELLPAPSEN